MHKEEDKCTKNVHHRVRDRKATQVQKKVGGLEGHTWPSSTRRLFPSQEQGKV